MSSCIMCDFSTLGKVKKSRPPHYREKGGLYQITIAGNSISIQKGYMTIPLSRTYSGVLNKHKIKMDNLATCVTNAGTLFIMDGRKIKAINRQWNKRKAYLQAILMKQKKKQYFSNLLRRITIKRNNRVEDC